MKNDTPRRNGGPAVSEAVHGWELLRADRGIVLVLALLVMLILSALGSVFLFLSGNETLISRNSVIVTQAFYAAEAGIDTAINQLPNTDDIGLTTLGNNAQFQTGPPLPGILPMGPNPNPPAGFNLANFSFNMYRVDVTGTVTFPSSTVALRVGATIGTPMAGTSY